MFEKQLSIQDSSSSGKEPEVAEEMVRDTTGGTTAKSGGESQKEGVDAEPEDFEKELEELERESKGSKPAES